MSASIGGQTVAVSPESNDDQRAAIAGLVGVTIRVAGLRRWLRVHGIAGMGAADAAIADLSQRRSFFIAQILSIFSSGHSNLGSTCPANTAGLWPRSCDGHKNRGGFALKCGSAIKARKAMFCAVFGYCGSNLQRLFPNLRQSCGANGPDFVTFKGE
jgi:hypothetical protein